MSPIFPPSAIFHLRRRAIMQGGWQLAGLACASVLQPVFAAQSPLVVLAASDLASVLPKITSGFEAASGLSVRRVFGSSGRFTQQIREGLPFDVFCSADSQLIDQLAQEGRMANKSRALALGRLALVTRDLGRATGGPPLTATSVAGLLANCRKVAIANPGHAPYGRAAQQALSAWGLWETVQEKLVLADNAAQATQFILQGAAQMALVPVALLPPPTPQMQEWKYANGAVRLLVQKIPSSLHAPLLLGVGLSTGAMPQAHQLLQFLLSPAAQTLLRAHGFDPAPA